MAKLFKNLTKQQKLVLWLESLGYSQIECRTAKYIAMQRVPGGVVWFIGKAGAFRKSIKGTITDSVSKTPDPVRFGEFCKMKEDRYVS